jgi:endoglucanase
LTDGGTFHERSRHFLRQWACAEGDEVRYSPRGRAVAGYAPTLGATAASAFLAAAYGDRIKVRRVGGVFLLLPHRRPRSRGRVRRRRGKKTSIPPLPPPPLPPRSRIIIKKQYYQPSRSDRYACWGLSQARYLLGDGGRSFVAGFGEKPPVSVQDEAASCPRRPAACDAVSAQLTPSPNPWVMPGALVDGPSTLSDLLPDVRPLNSSRVHLVNSAALYAAAAGAAESRVRWEVCLQGFGVLSKDTLLCGKGDKGL